MARRRSARRPTARPRWSRGTRSGAPCWRCRRAPGRARPALLGGPFRGRDRAGARLLGGHGEEPVVPRPSPAAQGDRPGRAASRRRPDGNRAMSQERTEQLLKDTFARRAESVPPPEGMYGRVRAHNRQRRRRVVLAAGLTAAVTVAGVSVAVSELRGVGWAAPATTTPTPGATATRGSLAGDRALLDQAIGLLVGNGSAGGTRHRAGRVRRAVSGVPRRRAGREGPGRPEGPRVGRGRRTGAAAAGGRGRDRRAAGPRPEARPAVLGSAVPAHPVHDRQ